MSAARRDYLRSPEAITARSFEIAKAETDLGQIAPELRALALRLVHAAGDPALVPLISATPGAVAAGVAALQGGAPVFTDARMVAAGITTKRLPRGNEVSCLLDLAGVAEVAAARGITRSAAGVEIGMDRLGGAVVAIGNAPTALFRLIEGLEAGAARPALVVAMPVGFVGAAESKEALAAAGLGVDYIVVSGRRGGSALASAAVNALAVAAHASEAHAVEPHQ